jgi:hypothetical protein
MISLGIGLGFKKIVLVGVDLNSNIYYFEKEPRYLDALGLSRLNVWRNRSLVHGTEDPQQFGRRDFLSSEFIPALAKAASTNFGCIITVASANSALARDLPLHSWGASKVAGKL